MSNFESVVLIRTYQIKGTRSVFSALLEIQGIGKYLAQYIINRFNLSGQIGALPRETLNTVIDFIYTELPNSLPSWLRNHPINRLSGESEHLYDEELQLQVNKNINILKTIKCYRGVYHSLNKKVRGQNTKSNGRRGAVVGVASKKK